jgi:hypothetical protein
MSDCGTARWRLTTGTQTAAQLDRTHPGAGSLLEDWGSVDRDRPVRWKAPAGPPSEYSWSGPTINYHQAQIHSGFGHREPTCAGGGRLANWLADEVLLGPSRGKTASA